MANEIGTATGLEDLFGKMVSFLTTNATLVAAGQNWTALRLRRDNLLSVSASSNFVSNTSGARNLFQIMRDDSRSLNTDNPSYEGTTALLSTNFVNGDYITMRLRVAKEVKYLKLKTPQTGVQPNIDSFRVQHSDDGLNWTTDLTVLGQSPWISMQEREFILPDLIGAHEYWRIVFDSILTDGIPQIKLSKLVLLTASGEYANHFGSEVIFKAPGIGGTDEIFTGIRTEYDVSSGWYNLFLNGYTGYDPSVSSWFEQPGALPGYNAVHQHSVPMVPLWDTNIPYWFVASGRSFRFATKVSTNCEGGYLGLFLPYATPTQYAYPLAVGGSLVPDVSDRSIHWRYSSVSYLHGVYPGPGGSSPSNDTDNISAALYIRNLDGSWSPISNRPVTGSNDTESIRGFNFSKTPPYERISGYRAVWPHCQMGETNMLPYRTCLGGGYILQECVLIQANPTYQVFGQLEGTYVISGFENSFENTALFNGKTHVVFQNAYRNSNREFWALSLD